MTYNAGMVYELTGYEQAAVSLCYARFLLRKGDKSGARAALETAAAEYNNAENTKDVLGVTEQFDSEYAALLVACS